MQSQQETPEAVVFDVDGTLIDSVDLHAKAWVDALKDYGHEVRFEDVRKQIGKGGDQLLPVFLAKEELDRIGKELEAHRGELFKQRYLDRITAFPAVRDLFQRLIADGKQIALASSAKEDELQAYKKIANIVDLIDAETSSDDADKSKPHPDIFQAALARLGNKSPRRAVVVGDTPLRRRSRCQGRLANDWPAFRRMVRGRIETIRLHRGLQGHGRPAGAL